MITVGMNYEILEGKEQPFERKFALVLEAMSQTPGHSNTNLYRDVFRGRSYLIVSEWETRAAFNAFVQSDTFRSVTNWGRETILASRPRHEVYGDDVAAPLTAGCPMHT
ncbi:MAG TPA: antibiotic biosynthesis monooxygenase [Nitrospiria bacterium]|nr:antibiotic biosynthesis monooxygenase [Nitrospiria bacterium]